MALGDVDGNAMAEIAVGSPEAQGLTLALHGAAYLYPDAAGAGGAGDEDGAVDLDNPANTGVYRGASAGDRAGHRVRLVDADDDGRADLAISAPQADGVTPDLGKLYVDFQARLSTPGTLLDLVDGALDLTVIGNATGGALGTDLAVADLDGDLVAELVGAETRLPLRVEVDLGVCCKPHRVSGDKMMLATVEL